MGCGAISFRPSAGLGGRAPKNELRAQPHPPRPSRRRGLEEPRHSRVSIEPFQSVAAPFPSRPRDQRAVCQLHGRRRQGFLVTANHITDFRNMKARVDFSKDAQERQVGPPSSQHKPKAHRVFPCGAGFGIASRSAKLEIKWIVKLGHELPMRILNRRAA
jgi:hypothetical protein